MVGQSTPPSVDSRYDLRLAAGDKASQIDAFTERLERWISLATFVGVKDLSETNDLIAASQEYAQTLRRFAHGGDE